MAERQGMYEPALIFTSYLNRTGSDIHHPQFTTHGDGGRVLQGNIHQRRYASVS